MSRKQTPIVNQRGYVSADKSQNKAYMRCYRLEIADPFNPNLNFNSGLSVLSRAAAGKNPFGAEVFTDAPGSHAEVLVIEQTTQTIGLAIDFTIIKKAKWKNENDSNNMKLTIYNLSEQNYERFKLGSVVTFKAGYSDNIGLIFAGTVISADRMYNGSESKTILQMKEDRYRNLATWQAIRFEARKGELLSTLVKRLCGAITTVVPNLFDSDTSQVPDQALLRDRVFVGDPFKALTDLITPYQMYYSTNNGVIVFHQKLGNYTYRSTLLTPETGLIGIPSRSILKRKIDNEPEKKDNEIAWNISSVMNYNFAIGDRVSFELSSPQYTSSAHGTKEPSKKTTQVGLGDVNTAKVKKVDNLKISHIVYKGNSMNSKWEVQLLALDTPLPRVEKPTNPLWLDDWDLKQVIGPSASQTGQGI